MTRALGLVLALSLAAARAPADGPETVVIALKSSCQELAASDPVLVDDVADQIEDRLGTSPGEGDGPAIRILGDVLATLPALRHFFTVSDPAEVHGAAGDVFLVAGRLAFALEAYRRAAESRPAREARCGLRHGGEVYTFEIVETTSRWGRSRKATTYLLSRDPATGSVLERFLLPSLPAALAAGPDGVHVIHGFWDSYVKGELRSVRLADGRLDYPVRVPESLDGRSSSRRGSLDLAYNFLWRAGPTRYRDQPSSELTLRRDPDEERPTDLQDLETELRKAVFRDPTQPWHLFLLGQCLWAQERRPEAIDVWEGLFAGSFPATPYYEYTAMARYFEGYRQPEWADVAFREALVRRRNLPVPVRTSFLIERLFNVPMRTWVDHDSWPDLDVERSYLWWCRLRDISGVSEGDAFRATLWANYFRSVGDRERTSAELAYLDRVRRIPWARPLRAYLDYTLWLVVASLAGLLVLWTVLFVTLSTRIFRWLFLGGRRRKTSVGLRQAGAVLVPVLALFVSLASHSFAFFYVGSWFADLDLSDVLERRPLGTEEPSREQRFEAALARHATGDLEQARQVYESLPPTPRVQRNLSALVRGLPPLVSEPHPHGAAADTPAVVLRKWIRNESWQPWRALYESRAYTVRDLADLAEKVRGRLKVFSTENASSLTALLAAGLLALSSRPVRTRLGRLLQVLIPGAVFLRRGQLLRAYLTLWLFLFAVGPLFWLFQVRKANPGMLDAQSPLAGPGFYSSWSALVSADEFALPPRIEPLPPESFWSLLWVYPHARSFYLLVVLALASSLGLHGRQVAVQSRLRLH